MAAPTSANSVHAGAPDEASSQPPPPTRINLAVPAQAKYVEAAAVTPGSLVNSEIHSDGLIATINPIAPTMMLAAVPAVHATWRARDTRPAPIAMPTIGTEATPKANAIGVSTVCSGDRQETAPTFRMSKNMSRWNVKPLKFSISRLRPLTRYQVRNMAPSVKAVSWPAATPRMPNFGRPNSPRPNAPPTTICTSAVPISVADGIRMSPVPRITEASVFTSQIEIAPENSTCE